MNTSEKGFSHDPNMPDEERLAAEVRERALNKMRKDLHETVLEKLLEERDATGITHADSLNELKEKASRDDLTGLLKRESFLEFVRGAQLLQQNDLGSIVMLDVDGFKNINDTFGHAVGDDVLKTVSKYLLEISRQSDAVCRWGGEEFALFFSQSSPENIMKKFVSKDTGDIEVFAMHVPYDFSKLSALDTTTVGSVMPNEISFSGGVTELQPTEQVEHAIERADRAMYVVKNSGKDRLEVV